MIKIFCDVCGKEMMRNAAVDRIKRRKANVTVEVLVAYKDEWNKGDVCEACVISIVSNGAGIERVAPDGVTSPTLEASNTGVSGRESPSIQ